MGAIHIFHAADARDFACRAASQLAAEGYSVRRLEAGEAPACDELAEAVLVVWSAQFSVTGAQGGALRRALARRVLAPISIGAIEPPSAYAHLWPIDLTGWEGAADDPRWQFVRDEIALARLREPPHGATAAETGFQGSARAAIGSRPRRSTFLTRMIPPAAVGVSVLSATAVLMATPQTMAPSGLQYRDTPPPQNEPSFTALAAADIETRQPAVQADRELQSGEENIATESVLNEKGPAPESKALVDTPFREEMAPLEALSAPYAAAAPEPASETGVGDTEETPVAEALEILQPAPLPPPAPDDYAGVVFRDCLDCPDMTEIPAGAFQMGSTLNDEGAVEAETPVRTVTISRPFALSRREITFDDWDKCVADGGCRAYIPSDAGWGRGARPVIKVSWEDAQSYTAWLAAKTGHAYRLPSEAEWEYAANASRQAAVASDGVVSPMLVNFEDGARASTAPTASFAPSAFGLYDMLGNVWEWVADCWRDSHADAPVDGSAIAGACETRVLKGGAFNSSAWRMRPAHRIAKNGAARESDNGFRVARDLP
jgi:formylglycine-generating enzyme required for sulfatase activity